MLKSHACGYTLRRSLLSHATPGYAGDKLRYLHLQAQQLVLRRQVESLIRIWGLPAEFEVSR